MLDHSLGETAEENEEVDAPHAIGTGTQHKLVTPLDSYDF